MKEDGTWAESQFRFAGMFGATYGNKQVQLIQLLRLHWNQKDKAANYLIH